MSHIIWLIYCLDLEYIWCIIICSILVWSLSAFAVYKYRDKKVLYTVWKTLNILAFIMSIIGIAYLTLYRQQSGEYALLLTPLQSFDEAKIQPEFYRSMIMNGFMFLPFGLTLPFVFPEKMKWKIIITVIAALIVSVSVEYLQYHYKIGRTETDDVITNTIGAAVGCIPYLISRIAVKNRRKS